MKVTGRFLIIVAGLFASVLILLLLILNRQPTLPVPVPTVTVSPVNTRPTLSPGLTLTPPPQPWNAALRLVIVPAEGAWLRSEPSYQSLDTDTILLPAGIIVRVIGQPVYEVNPGQWWWLVSAETDGIGWVEEASLKPASDPSD